MPMTPVTSVRISTNREAHFMTRLDDDTPSDTAGGGLDADGLRYVQGMERLLEAVCALASASTLEQIAVIVRTAARDLAQADGATFVLRDSGSCYYMDEDAIAPLWRGLRFPMETCISGWAMLHREGVAIPDIYADDRIPHEAYRPTFVKSLSISPIRTSDPIGAIGSYWATHHTATPVEQRLLQALADSTAVALESVRTLTELEDRVEQRTRQLAAANDDLRQFASHAAHDLREPISTIMGFAAVLRDELNDDGGAATVAVDGISRSGQRLLSRIDDLLTFARTGAQDIELVEVDLDELISATMAGLSQLLDDCGAIVELTPLGSATADQTMLSLVLQNLIANAVTYGHKGAAPRVRVDATHTETSVILRVSDNGPGVPPEERSEILEPFVRGSTTGGSTGTGLGLAICCRVAELHGGKLAIEDNQGGGAAFVLTLPAGSAAQSVGQRI